MKPLILTVAAITLLTAVGLADDFTEKDLISETGSLIDGQMNFLDPDSKRRLFMIQDPLLSDEYLTRNGNRIDIGQDPRLQRAKPELVWALSALPIDLSFVPFSLILSF